MIVVTPYDTTWSWDKCCLCQRDGIEKLYNPKHHKRFDQKAIYTLANLLADFGETGYMPKGIKQFDMNLVDDAAGIAQTMLKNNVLYHHSCRKKLSRDKLQKAKKGQLKIQQPNRLIW